MNKHQKISTEKLNGIELKEQIKKLIINLKPYSLLIIIAFILSIAGSIFTIIGPNQLSKLTDAIVNGMLVGINLGYVRKITIILVLLYLFSFIFSYLQDVIMAYVTQKFTKKIRNNISLKINKLPLKYFDNNQTGDILSRVSNDVDVISQSLSQSIGGLTSALTTLIGVVIMMLITNLWMTLTAISASLIGFLIMFIILSKSQKYFIRQQAELGKLNGHIEEIYSSHNVVKTYNGAENAKNKFNSYNETLFENAFKSQFLSGLMVPIMNFIGNFSYVAVCLVGAYLVMNNQITFGVIVAYMVYVRLFSSPLATIAQAANSLQLTFAASKRVFEFLDEEEITNEEHKTQKILPQNVKGNIKFENVKFGYNPEKLVIKGFSTNIKSGSKIAIVGPTGAGKTTLVNLIMRFYEIDSGKIIIDDIDIKELTRENIHDLFCMVLQDTWVFDGSIKENIIFNKENITDEEIKNVCKAVEIDHLIKSLPNGYNTILGDNETLSAGEKQLLTIARGMLESAPFLILDEATSNVDVRTEKIVQRAMDKLMVGKTSFIIAHRLSTIKNADLILVIKDGNIIEQGNHNELMKNQNYYFELYNSQFEN